MSKITKLIAIIAVTLGVAGGVITTTNPVTASASTKFRYYKNVKNQTYKIKTKKADIYSNGKLKIKSIFWLGAFGDKGEYVLVTYASHVTQNGKKTVYYKFKNASGFTGWVRSSALKKAKAPKSVTNMLKKVKAHKAQL